MVFLSKKFADAILALRTKQDMSFRNLSDAIQVDRSLLHKAETGVCSSIDAFYRICQWLDKPMESFFGTDKPKAKPKAKAKPIVKEKAKPKSKGKAKPKTKKPITEPAKIEADA